MFAFPAPSRRTVTASLVVATLIAVSALIAPHAPSATAAAPGDPLAHACAAPGSDEFSDATLDTSLWASSTGAPVPYTLHDGDLVLTTVAENSATVPHLQQPVPEGTWEITTEVEISPVGSYQQAGLMLRENASEWLALTVYHSNGQQRVQLNFGGANAGPITLPGGAGPSYLLRMSSDGTHIRGQYSTDGETFQSVGATIALGAFAPTGIGPTALRGASSSATEIDARFSWFRLTPDAEAFAACDGPLFNICAAEGSDEFEGAALDPAIWTASANGPVSSSLSAGRLIMPTVAANSSAAPAPLQPLPSGDWQVTTQVTIDPTGSYQQAGLLLWDDSDEWIVLDVYWSSGERRIQFNRSGNNSGFISVPSGHGSSYWFRLTNTDGSITGSYSLDGETFSGLSGSVALGTFAPIGVGPTALRGAASSAGSVDAHFEWFRWSPTSSELIECGHPTTDPTTGPAATAREAWRAHLIGDAAIDTTHEPYASRLAAQTATALGYWSSVSPGAEPWSDLSTAEQADTLEALRRIKAMAVAWATPGSALSDDPDLLEDTVATFNWVIAQRYYDGMPATGNWWYPQIGFPLEVNEIVVVLHDELAAADIDAAMDAVDHFSPSVNLTGANRVWKAMVVGLRGVIVGDSAKISAASTGLSPVFDLVTSGDGFYADGSFVQHAWYPYTGGYGTSLLLNLADILLLLSGTPWEVTDPDVARVYEWARDAFDPVMFDGIMMDSVRGREMSREYNPDVEAGSTALRALLVLAESAPVGDSDGIRAIVARHLGGDVTTFWENGSLSELALGEAAVASGSAAALNGTWAFTSMARVVHHDGDYAVAVAMSSNRLATFESINNENFRSWYTADGMTYVHDIDGEQFSEDYWATVNRYRLPGTTVDTHTRSATNGAGYKPTNAFAGTSAGVDGTAAASGMVLDAYGSDLEARKSWFFFDGAIVAVGSDISRSSVAGNGWDGTARHIETIIENRRTEPGSTLVVDGSAAGTTSGAVESISGAEWAQLTNGDSRLGYVFPDGIDLEVLRESRTGSWAAINSASGSSTTRTGDYSTLWIDHGTTPSNAGYAYIILPGATEATTEAFAAAPTIRILADGPTVSAAEDTANMAIAANFWDAATLTRDGVDYLTTSAPLSVTTERDGDEIALTIVEPTRARTGTVTVELHLDADAVIESSPGVSVVRTGPTVQLSIDVTNARGAAFVVRLALAP
ncbi:MAG TPA: hypothetical protein DEB55_01980 [Microbacterium sp.]|nr:hypothetical protein [Microbacterium sp.]|tara:strand:- start:981 stop:4610 length:3630 start_codon:yes stop_codon:yes gene_type:complete